MACNTISNMKFNMLRGAFKSIRKRKVRLIRKGGTPFQFRSDFGKSTAPVRKIQSIIFEIEQGIIL